MRLACDSVHLQAKHRRAHGGVDEALTVAVEELGIALARYDERARQTLNRHPVGKHLGQRLSERLELLLECDKRVAGHPPASAVSAGCVAGVSKWSGT